MNKRMKALTMMLVSMMAVSSLAGCGSAKPEANANGETAKTETKADASKEPVNLVYWTIGTEPKELKAVNDKLNEYTKEKLNVTLDIRYAGWGEYGEKLSKIVQSGEDYDLAFGAGINSYADLANKGYFADLKPLLPEVAPELNKFIPEQLWKGVTLNDQIFGVPAYKDSSQAQYWVWDKELVERLGIDYKNIKTLEELEPALKKIKEDNSGIYPLTLHGLEGINGFMASLNHYDEFINKPEVGVKYTDQGAKITSPWEDEETMNNLRTLNKWFNEGLINPDAATLKEYPKYRALSSDQGFPHADADWAVGRNYPVVSNMYFGPVYSTKTIQGSFMAVSSASKHQEEALKFIELINTDSYVRNLLAFGIEGQHYEKTGDNTIKMLNDAYQAPAYSQGTFFNMYVVDPAPATKWEDLKKHNDAAASSPALGFTFNTETVQNQVAACANIQEKYNAALITGSVNPDEVVPKMMEELNASGYQDILVEAQKQLDAYLGK